MKSWTLRLGLSLMVVVAFWTNRAPAQYVVGPGQQLLVMPTVPYEPDHHPYYPPAFAPRPQPEPAKHLPTRMLNHFGMGCQANRDGACGSLWSEMHFVLGSCRRFYGDQCVPCQPCADKHGSR